MTTPDLVVGLDSSTQSTKAIAWSREGEALAEGRAPIPLSTPQPGWAEHDPEDWWQAACSALKALTEQIDPARVAGLAISNQRETVAFVDADLRPTRPAIVWLDERAMAEVARLSEALGADEVHRITGKPPDITPVLYRLAWMRRHQPEALEATALLLDVHGYLIGRLTGTPAASWTSADPFGVFDIEAKAWSAPLLSPLGLTPERFAKALPPGSAAGRLTASAAAATGLAEATPVYAAGGDGQCAGLGVDAVRRGRVYLNLGTAIITGTWSDTPRIARSWRTMTSPTGRGYFLEGCQRAGAYFLNWFVDGFCGSSRGGIDGTVFARLEKEAAALPIGAQGLTVCPYLTGVMDPHWNPKARAGFLGVAPHHGQGHFYRAILEALTLESARAVEAMAAAGLAPERILAVGGGANSALWMQMVADATQLPITQSESLEASSLGAGMAAAVGAGWFEGFDAAATAMAREGETRQPNPDTRDTWQALSRRQALAYWAEGASEEATGEADGRAGEGAGDR
ncbi:MAG: FGGY family carbohydrate kinase [Pseudomonadota bacterium]